jgi:hypothetical protein
MPVWCVTGKLGAGKTLVAVSRIQKYLNENRRVATNLDLKLEKIINPWAQKTTVYRLPDIPTIESFKAIGQGYDGEFQGDHKNGLVVLDECALWLNTRSWNDKSRKALIDYFVHLRKLRWDLILIIQDIEALDKQFRDLYAEQIVYCSRLDRYKIPYIGGLINFMAAGRVPMPRVHIGAVYYNLGVGKQSHIENWVYRGNALMDGYNTEQGFNTSDSPEFYQYLPPNTVFGRYVTKTQLLKTRLKNIGLLPFFFVGLISGIGLVHAFTPDGNEPDRGNWRCNADWEALFGDCTLTKNDVRKAIEQYRNQSDSTPDAGKAAGVGSQSQTPAAAAMHPLDDVYISGSVRLSSGQYEYVFNSSDQTFYPYEAGYRVYDGTDCKAMLINVEDKTDRKFVYCRK